MSRNASIFAFLLTLTLCAADATAQERRDYRIGPRDVIEIRVFQDPNLNTTARVGEDGNVTMPLLGTVKVAGLTRPEVEAQIRELLLGRYMTAADVSVSVSEFRNEPISVIGAVKSPGTIPVSGNMTLVEAITAVGGLTENHGKTLYILRTAADGQSQQLEIDVQRLMDFADPAMNIVITPNDLINVPIDSPFSVYVLGEVMKPGVLAFKKSQDVTLLQVLAAAGGLTDRASRRDVSIRRRVEGKEVLVKVDLGPILAGRKADVDVEENDTIYVRESFF